MTNWPCPVELPDAVERCGRPRYVNPTTRATTAACYWHRLLRSTRDLQIREAQRREAARLADLGAGPIRKRVPEREWPTGERWCAGCQEFVPLFYCRGSRCIGHAMIATRASHVQAVYGLDAAGLAELTELQGGKCAICRKGQRIKALAIDHDHKTGARRGLLCQTCNHDLLGAAYDNVRILRAAVRYLETPPASGAWTPPEGTDDEPA